MIEYRKYHYEECKGEIITGDWHTGLDIYNWWVNNTNKKSRKKLEEQLLAGQQSFLYDGAELNYNECSMFED